MCIYFFLYIFSYLYESFVTGSNITISISVQNLPKNSSITDIVLRKPNGKTLIKLPIKDTSRHSTRLFYAEFQVPSQVITKNDTMILDLEFTLNLIMCDFTPIYFDRLFMSLIRLPCSFEAMRTILKNKK